MPHTRPATPVPTVPSTCSSPPQSMPTNRKHPPVGSPVGAYRSHVAQSAEVIPDPSWGREGTLGGSSGRVSSSFSVVRLRGAGISPTPGENVSFSPS